MYGTTETTVHASVREIVESDVESNASPIGVPLAHLGFLCAGRVVAAGARRVWSVSCTSPAPGRGTGMWDGRG